ncbi:type II and III secretion system protein [Marinobacter caseinilyticus]|uniref:type II and III secretion system protein n=1 Tax=Marinobacter caseinilyticus TaxID=2692195 RepID=UPI00140ADB70|nr:type II and III secretion system protein [Marinobacter caseinilyticus]
MKPHTFWLSLVLVFALPATVSAAPEARTYLLENRPAQDLALQLRDLYPNSQLAISSHGQQLIVRGEPDVLEEVATLVNTMDVAPIQLRVTVRSGTSGDGQRQGGGVSITTNGVVVQSQNKVTTTRRLRERNLVMQDGQSAHISSGQLRALPVAIGGGRNPAVLLQQVAVRSGFVVSPQVISDQLVELTVMAFENDPSQDIPGYDTEAVMTIRRVETGQWVELGSSTTRQSSRQSGNTYEVGGRESDNQSFEIRVEVL